MPMIKDPTYNVYAKGGNVENRKNTPKKDELIKLAKDVKDIERGCLIFWENHVAISISNNKIIHSNAKTMSVCIESFKAARKRISKTYGEVLKIRKVII